MSEYGHMDKAIAIVGLGAILPDAPDVASFWQNLRQGRYSIGEVDPARWDPADYYDPDPQAVDKTYSKIGGWVRQYTFDPLQWRMPIPPTVLAVMDETQKWAVSACRTALLDYGWPTHSLDTSRTAVILGNAMSGENHYRTALRIYAPEFVHALQATPEFETLPPDLRRALTQGMVAQIRQRIAAITEDTMPGELANIIAGRVANLLNLGGPNFVADAACASSFAALEAAVRGLHAGHFDAVLTGGVDRNMGASTYVKFSRIGALSPDGSRPFDAHANGFVMGEGAAILLLKRLADAERDGDRIYALIRGIGGASDGRGKGITAPNPAGQALAIQRAWQDAGLSPATVGYIEAHGTSTRVGDVAEMEGMTLALQACHLPPGRIRVGSVKSNIGHLKGAAGAAGLLKTVLALHHHELPPSLNVRELNPKIDFHRLPLQIVTELTAWERDELPRRAGISSFGFGGTNFHVVVEEYMPGMYNSTASPGGDDVISPSPSPLRTATPPLRGALALGAADAPTLRARLEKTLNQARAGDAPPVQPPSPADLAAPERLVLDFAKAADLVQSGSKALAALDHQIAGKPTAWKPLAAQGIFRGSGRPGRLVMIFPGQGSQYVNMLRELRRLSPLVAQTLDEADRIMTPLLGRPLTDYIMVDSENKAELDAAEARLKDTTITQPAVLTINIALYRLLSSYGIEPDMVIGHSLGEYAALVAAGVLAFADALRIVSARGREMSKISVADNGCMAAVMAPLSEVQRILDTIEGYVALANINSRSQAVIGGETAAVERAIAAFQAAGFQASKIPVSHAFHTRIVAPAGEPLMRVIAGCDIHPPRLPVIANVTGEPYPHDRESIIRLLGEQVASPVQFVRGVETLYRQGGRVFVEVGPKRVLSALVEDILADQDDVQVLFTNHPRKGDLISFNQALCGLWAAGVGGPEVSSPTAPSPTPAADDPPTLPDTPPAHPPAAGVMETILTLVSDKTGYPTDMLDPELDLEADLGIDTVKQAEVFAAIRQAYGIPRRDDLKLRDYNTLRKVAQFVHDMRPDLAAPTETAPAPTTPAQIAPVPTAPVPTAPVEAAATIAAAPQTLAVTITPSPPAPPPSITFQPSDTQIVALGRLMADFLAQSQRIYQGSAPTPAPTMSAPTTPVPTTSALTGSVVISGAGLGLPGQHHHVFQDDNVACLLRGEQRIEATPLSLRQQMADKRITRLVKSDAGATFEIIENPADTIKLAGRRGRFDLVAEFGVPAERVDALDIATQLAMAAGIEALRDAGIPLMLTYRKTSQSTYLPDRWMLPPALRDETGVIFASAFPGLDRMADEVGRYKDYQWLTAQLDMLTQLRADLGPAANGAGKALDRYIADIQSKLAQLNYVFDRKFVFRVLAMGHSQFAEYIGARGPNTHVNAACASTTHAVAIAKDWIRTGRCRRVVIVSGDDASSDTMLEWVGAGLLAAGATTTEEQVERAALPFDRRRNGTIVGMGAAALVIEAADALSERGMRPICEILAAEIANSAYHGTRLDVEHIGQVMERLVDRAEKRFNLRRSDMAAHTVFVSHETYTPARGGSAAAEIHALRRVFGPQAHQVIVANTKGYTGHAMGAGIEDVLAIKSLETGLVPPIANIHRNFEPDPELGNLNLARGGTYPLEYALRLGAGFGSQIAMTLTRRIGGERVAQPATYHRWLADLSGYDRAELEIRQRTLRIRDMGAPARRPAASTWKYGRGPIEWAPSPLPLSTTCIEMPAQAHTPIPAPSVPSQTIAPPPDAGHDEVMSRILALVSDKTGYPADMLDPELDLEADLGIDTVKQAEVFAAIRQAYDIPRRDDLKLRDYNTLRKVAQFVHDMRPDRAAPTEAAAPAVGRDLAALTGGLADTPPRRLPTPFLRPTLTACRPTAVSLDAHSRVIVVGDEGSTAKYLGHRLRARQVQTLLLKTTDPQAAAAQVQTWLQEGAIHGVYFLPGLDATPPLETMDAAQWRAENQKRIRLLYAVIHTLPQPAFLICATRMGGLHGYGDMTPTINPLGGAVAGFAKAYAQEHRDMTVKVVDVAADAGDRRIAELLLDETLTDPGAVEVGYWQEQRWGIGLIEQAGNIEQPFITHDPDRVWLITGGAGGIAAPILGDLAATLGGVWYLTGRTHLPEQPHPDLARLDGENRKWLKKDIAQRIQAAGGKPTPVQVEKEVAALGRQQAIFDAIRQVEQAGGTAHYVACDAADAASLGALIDHIQRRHGRLDVIIHAAGVERSHLLPDKSADEFDLVFGGKADGFFNLIQACRQLPHMPQAVIAFSSVAGRFGNAGQTDYSAANDLMCKMISALRTTYPSTRFVALDWSAWAEVGMATRGSIPDMMKQAGIELLAPARAAPVVRREMLIQDGGGEVLVSGTLGLLAQPRAPSLASDRADHAPSALIGQLCNLDADGALVWGTELDPQQWAYLRDHALDGTPLMPGVMGIEGFAQVAAQAVMQGGPIHQPLRVVAVQNVQFLAPLKFYRHEPRHLTWRVRVSPAPQGWHAHVSLESLRPAPTGDQRMIHFVGQVVLECGSPTAAPTATPPAWNGGVAVSPESIYRIYFHGPAFQVLNGVQQHGEHVYGRFNADLPPLIAPTALTLPQLVELCLQTAGVWEIGRTGELALPAAIERLIVHRTDTNGEPIYAQVQPRMTDDHRFCFDAWVLDQKGRLYLELQGYRTARLSRVGDESLIAPLRQVAT